MSKLCFPEKILEQHLAVLGKTGAGKSSALRHIVEHLLDHKKRVCIVDPKGDWWGLKKSADGKSHGYEEVIAFGDFKNPKATDIPINEHSGKQVAELIASGNRPCVIGFRGWMTGRMVRFWIDFASTLFTSNSGELYLVGDEFHNFAPKGKIMDPDAGKCLHWSNRLMSEGRGYGLVCLIASQRPQKVHNDTLTCCETLVAMRVIHKADRDAIQDWIEGCGDMAQGKEVLNSLAQMERGEAFVWSPEVGFGPKRLKFPMFETFDSFAPPQLQKKISDEGWASVDLEAVKAKLATVIEEQKANDPAELKREISRLKKELATALNESKKNEVLSLSESDLQRVDRAAKLFETLNADGDKRMVEVREVYKELNGISGKIGVALSKFQAQPQRAGERLENNRVAHGNSLLRNPAAGVPRPVPPQQAAANKPVKPEANGKLPKAESAILRVLANFPEGKSKREVGVIAGYAHNGGGFNNAVGALRSKGYVQAGEPLRITQDGMEANGPVDPLPTGAELFDYWMNHPDLGKAEREILRVLVQEAKGGAWSKEEIAPLTLSDRGGPYEANGGGFNNAVGRLRTYELIEGKGVMRAVPAFFT